MRTTLCKHVVDRSCPPCRDAHDGPEQEVVEEEVGGGREGGADEVEQLSRALLQAAVDLRLTRFD